MSSSRFGTINHLGLSVSDKPKSLKFYRFLLIDLLGYKQGPDMPFFTMFIHPTQGYEIIISPGQTDAIHNRYTPGYHHLAFNVDSQEQVNEIHEKLVKFYAENQEEFGEKAKILDAPAFYPQYTAGYYAYVENNALA
ncbi:hypothetical protein BGW42_002977 [Actinomortierella wolfii]|nr:hypothetical protein BGW42_002977 [Actinomortierella wolfii]